ncbi:MAG: hypothetical protein HY681_02300 [Chloroflexi bacterium]|nr:hypothetical protein [Chloroflexota bacterium]
MITRQMLEDLRAGARPGTRVLSIYLDVDPTNGLWKDKTYALERSLDRIAEGLERGDRKSFADDRAKAMAFLSDYRSEAKGLVLFVSGLQGMWWQSALHVPIENDIRYDAGPFLSPLASLLDEHQSCGVVMVDDRSARLFVVSMGEIEEQEHIRNEVPSRRAQQEQGLRASAMPAAGTSQRTQPSRTREGISERRHAAARQEHLKEVAETLGRLQRETGFRRLVIGGAVEALTHFEQELSPQLSRLVAGRFSAPMHATDKDILREAQKVEATYEQSKEAQTVQELVTRAAKDQMAVVGADQTLLALKRREVFELVTAGGLKLGGYHCAACGLITGTHALSCPLCGGQMRQVDDVVEIAVQQAVAAGARIEVVNGPAKEQLVKAGGLGALLSFKQT